jgi:ribosomal-protein-alanine N-acetyltransferase
VRSSIRSLQTNARAGLGLPFAIEYDGEFAGQLNVSGITYGSLSSATIGYWVSERFAGLGLTPTAVALASDYAFFQVGLHRMEICIRPENGPSLRVVEKLGFRYEGLRRRYIHINGDWRDHFCFALVAEELPTGVLRRWLDGQVPQGAGIVPQADRDAALQPGTHPR